MFAVHSTRAAQPSSDVADAPCLYHRVERTEVQFSGFVGEVFGRRQEGESTVFV